MFTDSVVQIVKMTLPASPGLGPQWGTWQLGATSLEGSIISLTKMLLSFGSLHVPWAVHSVVTSGNWTLHMGAWDPK